MQTSKHSTLIWWQKQQKQLKTLPNKVFIVFILIYRAFFSPSDGILRFLPFYPKNVCIFHPTCSEYGLIAFRNFPFLKAFMMTLDRIRRCHPGNEPRVDHPL